MANPVRSMRGATTTSWNAKTMGTNYYYVSNRNHCDACGRTDKERLHIGKSSGGWCFALHVIPERGLTSLFDWQKLFRLDELDKNCTARIVDEYGSILSIDELEDVITNRKGEQTQTPYGYESWGDFYRDNHAEPGPNGLVRAKILEGHCIGHGDGTWDLIEGEFC